MNSTTANQRSSGDEEEDEEEDSGLKLSWQQRPKSQATHQTGPEAVSPSSSTAPVSGASAATEDEDEDDDYDDYDDDDDDDDDDKDDSEEASSSSHDEDEDPPSFTARRHPRPAASRSGSRSTTTNFNPFAPPFYNRPPTPLPPSPSLTSLLRPAFSVSASASASPSRPTTPDTSDNEGSTRAGPHHGATTTTAEAAAAALALHTARSAAATTAPVARASPQVPTYEYYGFVLYLTSSGAFLIYLLWAYLPAPFLHRLGIYYYPNRWWALAIPAYLVMLVVYIYVALAAYNTGYLTLPLRDVECLVDGAAKIAVLEEMQAKEPAAVAKDEVDGSGGGKPLFRWRDTIWNRATDAVMDVPMGAVCEILAAASVVSKRSVPALNTCRSSWARPAVKAGNKHLSKLVVAETAQQGSAATTSTATWPRVHGRLTTGDLRPVMTDDDRRRAEEGTTSAGVWAPRRKCVAVKNMVFEAFFGDYIGEGHLMRRLDGCANNCGVIDWAVLNETRACLVCELGSLSTLLHDYTTSSWCFPEHFLWHVFASLAKAICFCKYGSNNGTGRPGWQLRCLTE
ncbi:MAG: hypothetical protein M1826_006307 [Phylliscum demangeonii]|nr:MAG: hypothetical protein M1826_006307 [Phylliscum demangeonii]